MEASSLLASHCADVQGSERSWPTEAAGARSAYEGALAFWYGRVNYEQLTPEATDLKLDRIRTLLGLLGNPHERLRIVHVAGSKGKGSTSAMLATILRNAGYRIGLFTSPHLCHVEERIRVDGAPISRRELTVILEEIRARAATGPRSLAGLTFFEIATAAGFLHFVRRRVETAIVEVGLGGRFDSTNVCKPSVCLISSISIDHTRQLGNRLASIAFEKAGIVKSGRPTISGATASEPREVIERVCVERGSPLRQLDVDFQFSYKPGHVDNGGSESSPSNAHSRVQITTHRRAWPEMELGLLGKHQAANAAVVVACVEELREQGWRIEDAAVASGLADVRWPARMEVVGRKPFIVLDCAHNVASAEALVETLLSSFPPTRRWLLFAGSSDKELVGMFQTLAPHFHHAFLTRYQNNPRSVAPEELGLLLSHAGTIPFTLCSSPAEALTLARERAGDNDLICITGSVFLAGELRPLLTLATA
jgi:dihydrofolate synthase / folylpolyglutamate synthase